MVMVLAMQSRCLLAIPIIAAALVCGAPQVRPAPSDAEEDVRLPNGKIQKDEILKADHEKNLEDAAKLAKLAEDLRAGLEKSDRFVLSIDLLKQTEEIEKVARRIRSRMKHQ